MIGAAKFLLAAHCVFLDEAIVHPDFYGQRVMANVLAKAGRKLCRSLPKDRTLLLVVALSNTRALKLCSDRRH